MNPVIAVVGAGFSGSMAALHLLSALPRPWSVLLCERAGSFGRGLAYGTDAPAHLLNLRAANMSAYPDQPEHFSAWLAALPEDDRSGIVAMPAGTFAPRALYGRYLAELLTQGVVAEGAPRLHLVHDAVTDLVPVADGYSLRTEGGAAYSVAGAVLAMGNLTGPGAPPSRHRLDPWRPEAFGRLHPDRPVLVVGTGLTMVDAVASLRGRGFSGRIVALSRRGLVPSVHAPTRPWPVPDLRADDLASLTRLTRRIRAEIATARRAGRDWRDVIDALRPIIGYLWRSLPGPERARFLRHLRPFWDVHRHRAAPPAAAAIAAEIAAGRLSVRAGRILAIADGPGGAAVTIRPRHGGADETLAAQGIVDATGIGRIDETGDPLLRRLVLRGLARPDAFGLGLAAGDDYRLRATRPGRLWTLGPLLRGTLWECVAVPDIRSQAAEVAALVATEVDGLPAARRQAV
ncbi:FAD/NAD(P)-binding protein [Methylobacterium nonmethylotrophicum]|uniref:Pyridine nucleotide-disulfide oxidoreductase n=1 Tax=Methylobacterium nonmethylotrophicum TaxID=1141884 RepID=A0A4Z0NJI4_9HYPH|nr:FAD/NAD(P)-binding protein [Methylobacterium nonmethylotrophicum]TGD96170.1 pyridine nucleotide-disulfide oxidoreductase [Methylobacterium nonmethylotrophicum]